MVSHLMLLKQEKTMSTPYTKMGVYHTMKNKPEEFMLVVVLDYGDGSVHFHKIPRNSDEDFEDAEDYLINTFSYSQNTIHWMEVLC